jgi:hypothetical protein
MKAYREEKHFADEALRLHADTFADTHTLANFIYIHIASISRLKV